MEAGEGCCITGCMCESDVPILCRPLGNEQRFHETGMHTVWGVLNNGGWRRLLP